MFFLYSRVSREDNFGFSLLRRFDVGETLVWFIGKNGIDCIHQRFISLVHVSYLLICIFIPLRANPRCVSELFICVVGCECSFFFLKLKRAKLSCCHCPEAYYLDRVICIVNLQCLQYLCIRVLLTLKTNLVFKMVEIPDKLVTFGFFELIVCPLKYCDESACECTRIGFANLIGNFEFRLLKQLLVFLCP